MEFPNRDAALAWVGRTLVDRDGTEIGACTAVFTDDATRLPEWVCSDVGGAAVFIPAVGAAESGDRVQVAVSRADVASAPSVGDAEHISAEEEAALYHHYGVPHSRDASPTLLATGEPVPPAEPAATGTAAEPAAVEEPLAARPVTPEPAAPQPVAPEPMPAELGAPAPLPNSAAPDSTAAPTEATSPPATPTGGRGRMGLVMRGLAAVGLGVGAALGARRIRQQRRRLSRTERLALRARAVSAALGARTAQVAASAAPVLEGARRVARRRPQTGAVVGGVPAAATLVAAVRRRRGSRERSEPDAP
jgi:hypothetical protein